jgi:hypothetical protein
MAGEEGLEGGEGLEGVEGMDGEEGQVMGSLWPRPGVARVHSAMVGLRSDGHSGRHLSGGIILLAGPRAVNGRRGAGTVARPAPNDPTLLCKSAPCSANDTIAVFSNWVMAAFRAPVLLFI